MTTSLRSVEEAVGFVVSALRLLPPRDAPEEPETLEVLRAKISKGALAALISAGDQSSVKTTPKPIERGGLACMAAPEIR